jgi:hypothetical protein
LARVVPTVLVWCGAAALVPPLHAVTFTDAESPLPVDAAHAAFAVAMVVPLAGGGRVW